MCTFASPPLLTLATWFALTLQVGCLTGMAACTYWYDLHPILKRSRGWWPRRRPPLHV